MWTFCRRAFPLDHCCVGLVAALVACLPGFGVMDSALGNQPAADSPAFSKPLVGHKKSVNCVRFTPDGKHVVSGSDDATARLWDVQTGKEVRRINYSLEISDVAFSPDGKVIFTSTASALTAWDYATFKSLNGLSTGAVVSSGYQLAIPDGERVCAAGTGQDKCNISVIDWKKERDPHKQGIWALIPDAKCAALSPDGKQVACGDHYGKIKVWTIEGPKNERFLYGHKAGIQTLKFSKDGKFLLSGSMDKTCQLWEVEKAAEVRPFVGHTGWVTAVELSPDGSTVLSGSSDETVRLWETKTGKELCRLEGHTDLVTCVAFSPDSTVAVSGSDDATIRLWSVAVPKSILAPKMPKVEVGLLKRLEGYTDPLANAIVSEDSQCVLFRNKKGKVTLWDVAKDQALAQLEVQNGLFPVMINNHGDAIWALSPEKDKLLALGSDNQIRLWNLNTGQALRTFTVPPAANKLLNRVVSLALAPDGKCALAGLEDGRLHLLDITTGQKLRTFLQHADPVRTICFSKDGRLAVSGSGKGFKMPKFNTVRVWDVSSGKELCCFVGHQDSVSAVAISPDSRLVLSGGWDKDLRLWEIEGKKQIGTLLSNNRFSIRRVVFSADGKKALACAEFGVRFWQIPDGKEIAHFDQPRAGVFMNAGFSPDGQQAVTVSYDRAVRLWKLPM